MKIAVAGIGYVGLSLSTLLSIDNNVFAYDISRKKVDLINKRISPIKDEYIEKYFKEKKLNLTATTSYKKAFKGAKYIIIATPTDYNEETNCFDTSNVEDIIQKVINLDIDATIVIKSTVPVGFVEKTRKKYNTDKIIFSPEFLRESYALYDNLYPSRIVIGSDTKEAKIFGELLKKTAIKKDIPILYTTSSEAEAIKLFSNTYLALRVAYFNELDTFCELNNLDAKSVIKGVCLDDRIGDYYNNPSFGYGGYCLPKDSKQLLANYDNIPQDLIGAIVKSNDTRKDHISNMILKKKCKTIGIYKLAMKTNSDNYRESAVIGIIDRLKNKGLNVIIYEPNINLKNYTGCKIENDVKKFSKDSDIILVNRPDEYIKENSKNYKEIEEKIYTRNLFDKD